MVERTNNRSRKLADAIQFVRGEVIEVSEGEVKSQAQDDIEMADIVESSVSNLMG